MTDKTLKGVLALAGTQHKKPLTPAVLFDDLAPPVAAVVRLVAQDFDVAHGQLLAEGRGTQFVAKARQVIMWACSDVLGMNMIQIGEALGRDRTSVRHGIEFIEGMIQADDDASDYLEALTLRIGEELSDAPEGEDMI